MAVRILVVDNDTSDGELVRRPLQRQGYHVDLINNIRDALTFIQVTNYDLIVSDKHMPGGDGDVLFRQMKLMEINIPVIFQSGGLCEDERVELLSLSPVAVLDKNDKDFRNVLVKTVADALAAKSAH